MNQQPVTIASRVSGQRRLAQVEKNA